MQYVIAILVSCLTIQVYSGNKTSCDCCSTCKNTSHSSGTSLSLYTFTRDISSEWKSTDISRIFSETSVANKSEYVQINASINSLVQTEPANITCLTCCNTCHDDSSSVYLYIFVTIISMIFPFVICIIISYLIAYRAEHDEYTPL